MSNNQLPADVQERIKADAEAATNDHAATLRAKEMEYAAMIMRLFGYKEGYIVGATAEAQRAPVGAIWVKGVPASKRMHFAKVKSMIEDDVIYDAVIWPVDGSEYWWCVGQGFKFDAPPTAIVAFLDLLGGKAHELEQLRQWKIEAVDLLTPINAYVHKHMECNIGDSCVELVLERCKDYNRVKQLAIDRQTKGDRLLSALRSLRLSVTAHPDYTNELNAEWTDLVETADEAIMDWLERQEDKDQWSRFMPDGEKEGKP